uniref:Uncharacterized protein n=1 Tax=Eucampia antarctica TaxID=49252 RepID=A0A7S2SA87_9STRA|mmetsp:Transcript_507/g.475  ORF Transcript_507/g.475 Transcript_507/m.475 type:complete len:258 (+) Transcript_507:6-779(+)
MKIPTKNELLDQCSLMMSYLGSELYNERGISSNLKSDLTNANKTSQVLKVDVGTISDVSAANKFQIVMLRKQNEQLKSRIKQQSQVILNNKISMKDSSMTSEMNNTNQLNVIEELSRLHKKEIVEMKTSDGENEKKIAAEIKGLTDVIGNIKDQHSIEIENLKCTFKKVQEDHELDLSRMLEALETTQTLSAKVSTMDGMELKDLKENYTLLVQNYQDDIHELKELVNLSCGKCSKKRSKNLPKGYEFVPRSSVFYG